MDASDEEGGDGASDMLSDLLFIDIKIMTTWSSSCGILDSKSCSEDSTNSI